MESDHVLIGDAYRQALELGACDVTAFELARQCAADLYPSLADEIVRQEVLAIMDAARRGAMKEWSRTSSKEERRRPN